MSPEKKQKTGQIGLGGEFSLPEKDRQLLRQTINDPAKLAEALEEIENGATVSDVIQKEIENQREDDRGAYRRMK